MSDIVTPLREQITAAVEQLGGVHSSKRSMSYAAGYATAVFERVSDLLDEIDDAGDGEKRDATVEELPLVVTGPEVRAKLLEVVTDTLRWTPHETPHAHAAQKVVDAIEARTDIALVSVGRRLHPTKMGEPGTPVRAADLNRIEHGCASSRKEDPRLDRSTLER